MPESRDPRDPLADQLRAWADAAEPVTPAEVRRRATGLDGRRRPPTRALLLAAAALALVAGVVGATVLRDDDTTPVETTNDPATATSTTEAPEPTSTVAPSSTTGAPATSTTVTPPSAGDGAEPEQWVGVDDQHRLVVVDTASGDIVRVLVTFDDPDAFGDGEEPVASGSFAGPIDVSPDGKTVFYETCCEPAVGLVFRIPITGGEPEQVAMGTNPAVSPDGTKLAVVEQQSLKVIDLVGGEETTYPGTADAPIGQEATGLVALRNPAWSPDGTAIALERYDDDVTVGRLVVVELDGGADVLLAARTVAEADGDGSPMHPTWSDDRTLGFVRQGPGDGFVPTGPAYLETVERDGGAPVRDRELARPLLDRAAGPTGAVVLTVVDDGTPLASPAPGVEPAAVEERALVLDGRWSVADW